MARSLKSNNSNANLGFEAKLWLAADKLRSNMDAAEYKHVVLGLILRGNANFAWVQHFIHHLAPSGPGTPGAMAGFVLANGSMFSNQSFSFC